MKRRNQTRLAPLQRENSLLIKPIQAAAPVPAPVIRRKSAQTATAARLWRSRRPPCPSGCDSTLGLNQQAFADRYSIPLRTLQEWEQRRSEPDAAVISYLRAIQQAPDAVAEALARSRAA